MVGDFIRPKVTRVFLRILLTADGVMGGIAHLSSLGEVRAVNSEMYSVMD